MKEKWAGKRERSSENVDSPEAKRAPATPSQGTTPYVAAIGDSILTYMTKQLPVEWYMHNGKTSIQSGQNTEQIKALVAKVPEKDDLTVLLSAGWNDAITDQNTFTDLLKKLKTKGMKRLVAILPVVQANPKDSANTRHALHKQSVITTAISEFIRRNPNIEARAISPSYVFDANEKHIMPSEFMADDKHIHPDAQEHLFQYLKREINGEVKGNGAVVAPFALGRDRRHNANA